MPKARQTSTMKIAPSPDIFLVRIAIKRCITAIKTLQEQAVNGSDSRDAAHITAPNHPSALHLRVGNEKLQNMSQYPDHATQTAAEYRAKVESNGGLNRYDGSAGQRSAANSSTLTPLSHSILWL